MYERRGERNLGQRSSDRENLGLGIDTLLEVVV